MLENRHVLSFAFPDPGADAIIPLLRVPTGHVYTIENAWMTVPTALGASTADYFAAFLYNGGTAGNGTTVISGTAGGTAGWAANTAQNLAITSGAGDLTAGQWLTLKYDETGTVAQLMTVVTVEYVDGIGSKA